MRGFVLSSLLLIFSVAFATQNGTYPNGPTTVIQGTTPWLVYDSTNNAVLTQIDLDLVAFKNANHSDLNKIDTDLNSFASANHTDLLGINTNLVAFYNRNHTDLTTFASTNHSDLTNINTTQTNGSQETKIVNSTGTIEDFNAGATGTTTPRVTANITRNGNELSYNAGTSDANTLRAAVNIKREGNDLDYNYGTVGANTPRTAAQVGNATGAADFNNGASTAQTLRTAANMADGSGNKITSTVINAKTRFDVNTASEGTNGSAVPFQTIQVGGSDGTNLHTIATDTNGQIKSNVFDGSGNAIPSTTINSLRWLNTNSPSIGIINSQGVPNSAVSIIGGIGDVSAVNSATFTDNGRLRVSTGYQDSFDRGVSLSMISQIQARFDLSLSANDVTSTVSGGGSTTQGSGKASLVSGTSATASAKLVSNRSITYHPFRGIYAAFTAAFTVPTSSNSEQRAGIYDANNGFFLGYHGTTFGFTVRNGGSDTFTSLASAGFDPVNGSTNSLFTRAGVPEALDVTKENIYLIDFAWLGAAPIRIKVFSPDGRFINMFTIRQPNTSSGPSIQTAILPITFEVTKTGADATSLTLVSSSWDGGVVDSEVGLAPEDIRSRKYVTANLIAASADTSIYTVSTGRTLHVTGGNVTCFNSSLSAVGLMQIRDGATGTILMPITTNSSTNQSGSAVTIPFTLPTGMKFTNAVYADFVSGTLTCTFFFTGYEAEI